MTLKGRSILKLLVFCLLTGIALSSCHSKKKTVRWVDPAGEAYVESSTKKESKGNYSKPTIKADKIRRAVCDAACDWIGVPYRYGGNDRRGVDCSGLVCNVFKKAADIKLPRVSTDQAKYCRQITRKKAQPGDLVFFTSKSGGNRINHVAIYLGEGKVVHSTSSRGVIISSLDDQYWRTHYHSFGTPF